MARFTLRTVLAAMFGLAFTASAFADDVTAIATGRKGDLTKCSYWGCNLYHHIKLPQKIAVGDSVTVHFGSNPKRYSFPVARIIKSGDLCTVYSQTTQTDDVEKIEITPCTPVPAP
jgi:hypothetical protein